MSALDLVDAFTRSKVIELAHPLEKGIPVSPNHPGFHMALLRRHGDQVRDDGGTGANELIVMGGHTGTHIDSLCHVAHDGVLHGGVSAEDAQVGGRFSAHGVETIGPIVTRGVLLDIPHVSGCDVLAGGQPVTGDDLDRAASGIPGGVPPGAAVLVRTGWSCHWDDPDRFRGSLEGAPGVDPSGADWIRDHDVRITGSDTMAYEQILHERGHAVLPVHRSLLVEAGINIIEMLALDELAGTASEFLFVLAPLKVVGATGVPVNPLAIVVEA